MKKYKIIHPIKSKGITYPRGSFVELDEITAGKCSECLELIEEVITAPELEVFNFDEPIADVETAPVLEEIAEPEIETPKTTEIVKYYKNNKRK